MKGSSGRSRQGFGQASNMTVAGEKDIGKGDGVSPQQMRRRSLLCMALLTLQYGVQPLLTQHFSGKQVIMTSVVLTCELVKVFVAVVALIWEGSFSKMKQEWSFMDAMRGSALPAIIYAVQNSLVQVSYRNLDSLTATMLNQTKLAFTAFFMFLILGQRQSRQQIGALMLLLVAATLLSLSQKSSKSNAVVYEHSFILGVIPVLVASVLSGLASTLCQWAVQVKRRSSYLMTVEMSGIGSLCLFISLSQSPDGDAIRKKGFFFWLDSIDNAARRNQCLGRNSCWLSNNVCRRREKGLCDRVCFACNSAFTSHSRWSYALLAGVCRSSSCRD